MPGSKQKFRSESKEKLENRKNIVKISDDVNDVDKFCARRRKTQKPERATKNSQSALINVWRTSGVDAEVHRWKHFRWLLKHQRPKKKLKISRRRVYSNGKYWMQENSKKSLTEVNQTGRRAA